MRKKTIVILMLLGLWHRPLIATPLHKDEDKLAIKWADGYLNSFSVDKSVTKPSAQKINPRDDKKRNKVATPTEISLSPRAERALVLQEIFASSPLYQHCYGNRADQPFNPYAWNDLHLFCGTTTTPSYHLLSRINKTITVLGESALASLLAVPTADLAELTQRQQFIKLLCKDQLLYQKIKELLHQYKRSEQSMLSFWSDREPLYNEEYDKYLTRLFYQKGRIAVNKNASSLQTRKIWLRDIWNIYSNFVWFPLVGTTIGSIAPLFSNSLTYEKFYSEFWPNWIPGLGIWNIYRLRKKYKELQMVPAFVHYLWPVYFTIHSAWQYYKGVRNYKEYAGVLNHLALRMADIQTFVKTAEEIHALVEANPEFSALYRAKLKATAGLLLRRGEASEVGNLLLYLDTLPLRSWRYLSSHAGKLLASYKLFVEHKAVFHDALYELGQLDAFLAMATLMEETAALAAPHRYTFTALLPHAQYNHKPHLTIKGMWNPMLDPKVAIGNDIAMGAHTPLQTMILTGPNAGGKSTFLTGITYTILLSQVFGIAPAQSCALTPFHRINTYIDVTDDIAAGKSLYISESERFNNHAKMLKSMEAEACSFTIFDEPFSGTNPEEAATAEYSVLNYIARYTNALNIVATHYPLVMCLEDMEPHKGFKNYKVFIKQKGRGAKIVYTYKIIPGKSEQTIAIDILEEQGYDPEILEEARDMMKNKDKYRQSFIPKSPNPKK